jgi:hypothetical protein
MFDHLVHIHQQLKQREIIFHLQSFKHVNTWQGKLRYEVEAYNEYLLLTNASALPVGTRIISDTNSLEITTAQNAQEALEEFSGLVSIEFPENNTIFPIIEFIQIVKG